MRKEAYFKVTDKTIICYEAAQIVRHAMTSFAENIKNETLADHLIPKIEVNDYQKEWSVNQERIAIGNRQY